MVKVISNIDTFYKGFPKTPKSGERKEALARYFAIGGVVKVAEGENEKEWPKLVYPTNQVIESKIKDAQGKKKIHTEHLNDWKKKYSSASNYHSNHQIKKLKEPLYWKHMAKMATDPDYRKDAESVKLPAHLVADKKWQPMVKMFVNDLEYRKQLSETVKTSIIYKKNRKVAKYADELKDFRMETSDKQVQLLEKKIDDLALTEKALKEIQKWSKE